MPDVFPLSSNIRRCRLVDPHCPIRIVVENVTKLRVRELLSDEEFTKERETLQQQRFRLTQQMNAEERPGDWIEPARLLVLFSNRAISWFSEGNHEVKRLVLAVAGSNPTLSGRRLNIDAKKPFQRRTNANDFDAGWTLVEDVRTQWHEHDREIAESVAMIQRLNDLMRPSAATRVA